MQERTCRFVLPSGLLCKRRVGASVELCWQHEHGLNKRLRSWAKSNVLVFVVSIVSLFATVVGAILTVILSGPSTLVQPNSAPDGRSQITMRRQTPPPQQTARAAPTDRPQTSIASRRSPSVTAPTYSMAVELKPAVIRQPLDPLTLRLAGEGGQFEAAQIISCLNDRGAAESCPSVHDVWVIHLRDELRNKGVEFSELNAIVASLEARPTVEGLRAAVPVLRAVADQLIQMAHREEERRSEEKEKQLASRAAERQSARTERQASTSGAAQQAGTVGPEQQQPELVLPAHVSMANLTLSRTERISLSERAGNLAGRIDICMARQREGEKSERDIASYCNYMYGDSVIDIRNRLRNAGTTLDPLEQAVQRIQNGPAIADLQFTARLLDRISQELGKANQ